MYWVDGYIYRGYWLQSVLNGIGFMIFPDGFKKLGFFQDNVFKPNLEKYEQVLERPYIFFLRFLLTTSGIAQTKPRESAQYHQLLLFLFQLYMKYERREGFTAPLFDHLTLLNELLREVEGEPFS